MSWNGFLALAPERVVEVIEDGPFPYPEYGAHKLRWKDKQMGIMRFKGGDGNLGVKHGQRAVLYFDPDFMSAEYPIDKVPEEVHDRHARDKVIEAWKEL